MQSIGQGLTLGVTLPVVALGAASVKAASDAEETRSKFQTVFRDISESAQNAANELRNSYGLSAKASQQLLSDTGDLLTGFGFSQQSALDLSTEVNKLAVDLASFTNYSGGAKGASEALTKALLGERESVKSLGISILEADVQARVLQNTQDGLTFETERQAKAFATLQLAQEQSKNAIGDYARTSESFANTMRRLRARLEDVAVQFGEILLPYATKLTNVLEKVVNWFSELEPSTKKIIVVIAGLAAAIGPVLTALGFLTANIIPAMVAGFTALTGPIGLVIAAIAGIAIAVYKNWEPIKKEFVALQNYFIDLYNESTAFRLAVQSVILTFKTLLNIGGLVLDAIGSGIRLLVDQIKNVGAVIKAVLTGNFESIPDLLRNAFDQSGKNFAKFIGNIGKDVKGFTKAMQNDIDTALNNVTTKKRIANVEIAVSTPSTNQNNQQQNSGGTPGREQVKSVGTIETSGIPLLDFTKDLPEKADLIKTVVDDVNSKFRELQEVSMIVGSEVGNAFNNLANNLVDSMGLASDGFQGFVKGLVGTITKLISMMLAQSLAMSISNSAQSAAATGPGAVFTQPAFMATLVGGVLSAFASIPKFADGGIVSGPTLGLMGEYSGARNNPEVIAPLDKLKGMISDSVSGGGTGGVLKARVTGRDLEFVLEKQKEYNERLGN